MLILNNHIFMKKKIYTDLLREYIVFILNIYVILSLLQGICNYILE